MAHLASSLQRDDASATCARSRLIEATAQRKLEIDESYYGSTNRANKLISAGLEKEAGRSVAHTLLVGRLSKTHSE